MYVRGKDRLSSIGLDWIGLVCGGGKCVCQAEFSCIVCLCCFVVNSGNGSKSGGSVCRSITRNGVSLKC